MVVEAAKTMAADTMVANIGNLAKPEQTEIEDSSGFVLRFNFF